MIYRVENINDEKFSSGLYLEAYTSMSEERKQKASRLMKEKDKRLCVFSDYLLREMLKAEGVNNPQFCIDSKGKPYLKNINLHFSISHSENFIACAVDIGPIGLDIETYRNIPEALINRVCTEDEIKYIFQSSSNLDEADCLIRFFSLWTAKEAYLKCIGEGLSGGMKNTIVATEKELKKNISPYHKLTNIINEKYSLSVVESI